MHPKLIQLRKHYEQEPKYLVYLKYSYTYRQLDEMTLPFLPFLKNNEYFDVTIISSHIYWLVINDNGIKSENMTAIHIMDQFCRNDKAARTHLKSSLHSACI